MATSRFSGVMLAIWCLACTPPGASEPQPSPGAVATIARQEIEHITPSRDFVGVAPQRFEWTAISGVDSYSITVLNEVDAVILDARGLTVTSMSWPKERTLDPGTYFWRVVGIKDGRSVADSGRAAFVVRE